MPTSCKRILPVLALLCGLIAIHDETSWAETKEPSSELAQYYGFLPVELFKLEKRSGNMLSGDFNNDGRSDLILVDNSNSRLDLLIQLDGDQPAEVPPPGVSRVNFIGNDGRFRHEKITVDKAISSLALGDFNNDGRTDIVYFGGSDQLVFRLQDDKGGWQNQKRIRLPDVQPARWNTAVGDLNGDGQDDIVVLGTKETYLIYQQPDGSMASPKSVRNTSDKLTMAQITDLDGDGRDDLCYLSSDEDERPLCARMQDASGQLGPEYRFELDNPRAWTLQNIDGQPGDEILTIESRTGRVKVHKVVRPQSEEGELAGRMIFYGFGSHGSGRNTDLDIGDLDGDGLDDVVVTDPDGAQVIVFLQHKQTGLDQGHVFPSLTDAQQVRVGNLDDDPKQAEVIILSEKENAIGFSRMTDGRLTFPRVLPLVKEPMAVELADLDHDGKDELICLSRDKEAGSSTYELSAFSQQKDGEWTPQLFSKMQLETVTVKLKNKPERLMKLDANADGRIDFLVFAGSEPVLFLSDAEGILNLHENQRGLGLGKVGPGALFVRMAPDTILLVAQQNFARNMKIDAMQEWQVLDQYNAIESNAKIEGAAQLNLDQKPGNEIVLVDGGVKKLRILRMQDKLFRPWKEVEVGEFRYKATRTADLNGDGKEDLLLFGVGRFGVLYSGQTDPELTEVASYETKLEDARFADLVAGDLNGDGFADIACLDTKTQLVEILDFDPAEGLRHALYFKIYEAKSLNDAEKIGTDPREALIYDVTGDGRNDLLLLSHDRVLLYPQDPGE